jgi:hypothetical protein
MKTCSQFGLKKKNSTKMYASPYKMYRSAAVQYQSKLSISVQAYISVVGLAVAGVKGCLGLGYLNTERVTRLLNKLHKVSLMVCILQKFCR